LSAVVDRPSPKTLIVIQTDPTKSHRAVEALRIALGLGSHNEGQDVSIVLCGRAPHLLAEDNSDIVDAETLEKHLPVFIEWETPFLIATDAETPRRYVANIVTKPVSYEQLVEMIFKADRVITW